MTIKMKLILTLSLILLVSFVVTSVVNYRVSRESIRNEILKSSLPLTSENIYSEILMDLLKPINIASLMANDTFLREWANKGETDPDPVVSYLKLIKEKYNFFATFFVSAKTSKYYHSEGVLKKVSRENEHDIWFYKFIDSGQEYNLDVDTNEAHDNNLTIFINFRIEDDKGNLLGVTGVGLEMDKISKLLEHYQRTYHRTIYITDKTGLIQVHTDQNLIESATLASVKGLTSLIKDILTPRTTPTQYQFDRDESHILLSTRYIPEFDWFLLVEQDESEALASARSNLVRTLLVGFVASIIIIFLSIISVNHFQTRLEYMAATDELTGIGNRREFKTQFNRAVHRYERYGTDFSLVLLDIDELKQVNDTLGHLVGDDVITSISDKIVETVRTNDIVARWGGDEFIILIEGEMDQTISAVERIRLGVIEAKMPQKLCDDCQLSAVSVSCGISQYKQGDTLDAVTSRADKAMYRAKKEGKNKVVAA